MLNIREHGPFGSYGRVKVTTAGARVVVTACPEMVVVGPMLVCITVTKVVPVFVAVPWMVLVMLLGKVL